MILLHVVGENGLSVAVYEVKQGEPLRCVAGKDTPANRRHAEEGLAMGSNALLPSSFKVRQDAQQAHARAVADLYHDLSEGVVREERRPGRLSAAGGCKGSPSDFISPGSAASQPGSRLSAGSDSPVSAPGNH